MIGIQCVNLKNKVILNQYHDDGFHLQCSLQTTIFHVFDNTKEQH